MVPSMLLITISYIIFAIYLFYCYYVLYVQLYCVVLQVIVFITIYSYSMLALETTYNCSIVNQPVPIMPMLQISP